MAEEITRRMGVKVAWEKIDFKGIVAALTAKRVDALITALTWTPERAERIAFSDPYFDAGIGAITPQSSTIQKAEDLTGKKVGVQLGSSRERYVRETIGPKLGQLLTYDSITLAINDLKNGRVDAVVNPLPVRATRSATTRGFAIPPSGTRASSASIRGSMTRNCWRRSTATCATSRAKAFL